MKHIKYFENFRYKEDIIVLIGLPGSGKTSLATHIKNDNPQKSYKILDDFEYRSLNEVKENNLIISDTMLFYGLNTKLEDLKEKCELYNKSFGIYYFTNDPKSCIDNIEARWETMSDVSKLKKTHHNPFILKGEIMAFSRSYKIPPNAETIPVFKKQ